MCKDVYKCRNKKIVYLGNYPDELSSKILEQVGIKVVNFKKD